MVGLVVIACLLSRPVIAQVRLVDEFDRAAFRAWFVWLADAQFNQPSPDVTDCAALVRHQDNPLFDLFTPLFTGDRAKWVETVRDPANRTKADSFDGVAAKSR